ARTVCALGEGAVADNECVCGRSGDFLITDLLAAAWSLRVTSNRMEEPLLRAFSSALAIGLLCTAALNQSTHCVLVASLLGAAGRVNKDNLSLIDALSVAGGRRRICPPD